MATWFGAIGAALFGPATLGGEEYTCGADQCRSEGGDAAQIAVTGFAFAAWGQAIGAIWPGSKWLPLAPMPSTSNGISPPPRGSHVRITAPGYAAPDLEGDVATATSDSLSLLVRSNVINVPMAAVSRLEYANGPDRAAGAVRGMLQAIPLAGFQLAIGWLDQSTDVYRNGVLQENSSVMGDAALASALTLGIGAGLGAIIAPPAWAERRSATGLLVAPDAQRRAMRVGLAMRF